MRLKTVLAATAVASLALLGTGTPGQDRKEEARPANLLVNGSFEEGPEVEGFKPLDEDSTEIRGWIVTRGQIDYIGTHWKAADGKRSLDLHGSPGFGGVKQTFTTREGQRYRVSFSLAGSPGRGEKKVGVRAAGKKTSFSCDGSTATAEEMGWATKTWEFTAIADHTTLEIHTLETEDPNAGPALDNVAVVVLDDK
jgi:choice-of-anchor C domain-containing protein